VLRSRDAIVRCRTLLINHTRDIVTLAPARSAGEASGSRLPSCSADSFARKAAPDIPEPLRPALLPILDTIASLTQQIQSYDQTNEELCSERYPETRLLRAISGVGPLTSLAFILTLENPDRFRRSREVGPAIGLVPRRDQSGDQDPQLRTLAPALQVQVSRKRETPTCAACWLDPHNTSWVHLGPIVICDGGD
jgi:transposase